MTYILGARSLGFITRVHPDLVAVAKHAITLSTQDFGFTEEQSRTQAEENALFAKGVSHTRHSHHLIDPTTGYSGAVDAVPWNGEAFVWDWDKIYPIAAAFKAASLALNIPVTWGGGDWQELLSELPGDTPADMEAAHSLHKGFDGPHFELGRN